MVSSVLASRAIPMAARSMRGVRYAHVENTFETAVPFKTGTKHKTRLMVGVFSFCALGYSLPFIATRFQIKKSG
ncbi:uncharacterized protein FA14DRAFT_181493 [Meira miltonrushii]|uniref:Cytochrome c oxidase subunit 8, mitochondrial n=1 Tax=Meira miltonrushii TaxID=1280837 RepID=A0A316V5M0_9BASI|nr:uncharacterized protein FA14DRAFT_181493 [Meira miltonrushii]PWN32816.1 hypothetical protein FA14DRAFT_181493 [Meira miltonrushii]